MDFENTLEFAQSLDQQDELRDYRNQFHIPQHNGKDCIYFTGNSLGLQPKTTEKYLKQELEDWKNLGVEGHFEGKRPWFHYHKFTKEALAKIVGAKPVEVVALNNLTSNLHFMMVSFYRPSKKRYKIIAEAGAFPSDQYALETQIKFHATVHDEPVFDPNDALVELKPREGEHTLRKEDIITKIKEIGEELALVMIGGVQYYTGQFFDIKSITQAAHDVGAYAGFDLAHGVGNVPVNLHDSEVDFAVWCSYKYLNSGPGGTSGIFVHEKHGKNSELPRFGGWWGHSEEQRFLMKKGFIPMEGADGWQLSNVNVLTSAAHLASLEIFNEVSIDRLRAKSVKLTGYLEYLINELNVDSDYLEIITPSDPEQRGCQLSLFVNKNGRRVFEYLTKHGVIADWREPNVIRVAPVPLYNTFEDVYRFVSLLKEAL